MSTEGTLKFNTIRRMSVWVSDGSGEMEMVFFKGIKWMYERLKPGVEFIFFGKPTAFNGRINMVHPEVDAAPAPAPSTYQNTTQSTTPQGLTDKLTTHGNPNLSNKMDKPGTSVTCTSPTRRTEWACQVIWASQGRAGR